ncbi:hypothetical protein GW796_08280 [archaeon]|nr:hypothetical protein [archaeon]
MTVSDKIIKHKIAEIIASKNTDYDKIKAFEIFIEEIKIGYYMKAHNEISREKANKRREQNKIVLENKNGNVLTLMR